MGWGLFVTGYLIFAIATVATLQAGLHGDPRTTNPNPGPAPYPPFLDFGLVVILGWLSYRQRRVHWAVIIAFAGLITGALDPLANWATFAVFEPRMLHFPLSWPDGYP
jgi:hypothetical protein